MMHKHWTGGLFLLGIMHTSCGGAVLQDKGPFLIILRALHPIGFGTNPFAAPRCIVMLSSTKDVLSLALYLADTTSCTICESVQDGIALTTPGHEKKGVLASLAGFAISSSNIVL